MTTSALTHTTASNNKRRNEDDGKPRNICFLIGLSGNDGCEAAIRWANANFIRTTDRVVFLLTIKPKITDGFAGLFRHRSPMLIDLDDQRLELTSFFSNVTKDVSKDASPDELKEAHEQRKFEICVIETRKYAGEAILAYLDTELFWNERRSTFLILGRADGNDFVSDNISSPFSYIPFVVKRRSLTNYLAYNRLVSTVLVDLQMFPNIDRLVSDSVASAHFFGLSDDKPDYRTVIIVIDVSSEFTMFEDVNLVNYCIQYILEPTDRVKLITFFRTMAEFDHKLKDISFCEEKLRKFLIDRPKKELAPALSSLILHLGSHRHHAEQRRHSIFNAVNQYEGSLVIVREIDQEQTRPNRLNQQTFWALRTIKNLINYFTGTFHSNLDFGGFNAPVLIVRKSMLDGNHRKK